MDTLPAQILGFARRAPSRTAFVHHGLRTSYARFAALTTAFSAHLIRQGLEQGDRVAILLPNQLEAAVAVYGTWLAGGIAVPLNLQAKSPDLVTWLRHSGARHLLAATDNIEARSALERLAAPPSVIDVERFPLPGEDGDFRDHAGRARWPQPTDPAAIVYTSGTTGTPKGVTLTHRNLIANARAIIAYLELGDEDSVLSVLPFYYAYGASVLHTHLLSGATIHIADNPSFPGELIRQLRDAGITGFSGVSSSYALLLDRMHGEPFDLPRLRYVTQAGDAIRKPLLDKVRAAFPDARVYLMYGQTEATSRLTWLPPERLGDKAGSVGIPVAGVRLRIVAEDGTPMPAGAVGEVCARGENIMAGYWNADDATRRVLDDGWLRTGDIGRLDDDGFLFLEGRHSEIIKTGGNRVYPGDVEAALLEIPAVADAAVVGVADDMLGQAIKAYIVLRPGMDEGGNAIKAHCRSRLPYYKIPKDIAFIDMLPRTASGKIRRAELSTAAVPR